MSEADLESWGWRIPFFVGAALAGSVWIARSTMQESPEFERQQAEARVPDAAAAPRARRHRARDRARLRHLGAGLDHLLCRHHLRAGVLDLGGALAERDSLWLSTIAAVAVILVTPLAGAWSDRVGRKPVLIGSGVGARRCR